MTRILLTGTGPEHRYVANHLVTNGDVDIVIVEHGRRISRRRRARQLVRRYGALGLGSRSALAVYRAMVRDSRQRSLALRRALGPQSTHFAHDSLLRHVESVNDPSARQIVGDFSNVRILVYGTGIVGPRMLQLSEHTPLNMHTGVSPYYRGSSCAFWPVHNSELNLIGATVHAVTSSIDGGQIYGTERASLEPDDGIHEIFGRAVVAGTQLYLEVLSRIDDTDYEEAARPQDLSIGVEYRVAMRGLRAEARTRRLIRQGAVRRYCQEENHLA